MDVARLPLAVDQVQGSRAVGEGKQPSLRAARYRPYC